MSICVNQSWILVVDDDPDFCEITEAVLVAQGWNAVCATDGVEALARMSDRKLPDLILLDLRMPRMNGAELARELRQRGAEVPIVVVSGDGDGEEKARALFASRFLSKPVALADLLSTVEEYCPHG